MSDVLLVFPRAKYPSGDPPLGVGYLAACLRAAGHRVRVLDMTFERRPLEALAAELRADPPALVGISTLTSMLDVAARAAQVVKRISPQARVIIGGPHATVEPASTAALDDVDAVALGEGELSLPALVDAGLDWRQVPGFGWLEDGEYRTSGPAPFHEDLDQIPYPAWDLLPMGRYLDAWYQLDSIRPGLRGTSIIASRGCPFDCAYCQPTLRTIFGRRLRRRSPDNVIGELIELKARYRVDGLMWLDDTFLVDGKWVRELCARMVGERLDLLWGCNVRADMADPATLAAMKEAGLRVIHVGIESATQRILDEVYHKRITVEQVQAAVHAAVALGLKVRGYFMVGAPGETEKEARDTVRLACELPLDEATFSITTPLPHTHLWDKTRGQVARGLGEFDYYKVPVYGGADVISPARLVRLKRAAYLRFYLGPRRLRQTVSSMLSLSGLRKALLKVKRF